MTDDQTEQIPAGEGILTAETAAQFGRGVLMGLADVIPGVSGGTVALILGIYERLVTAISHVDRQLFSLLGEMRLREAFVYLDLKFLIPLICGIACGIAALGAVMHSLLENYLSFTMAAFFGMIGASCYLVGRLIHKWRAAEFILLIAGAWFAWWLVQQPALANPPDSLWYVFCCGVIAICAMILPGISGAFILVILGKYHDLTGIIKQTLHLEITVQNVLTVIVFGAGCFIGLTTFAKVLKWLLKHHGSATMSALCGFMAGSLYKIWPFQIDTTPDVAEFKHKVFQPIFTGIAIDGHFWATMAILICSGAAVLWVEHFATRLAEKVVQDDPA
jgi:putative membrane protein